MVEVSVIRNLKVPPYLLTAGDGEAGTDGLGAAVEDATAVVAGMAVVVAGAAVDVAGLAAVVAGATVDIAGLGVVDAWLQPTRIKLMMSANAKTASVTLLIVPSLIIVNTEKFYVKLY
jgi:hypothetical protein